MKKDVKPFFVNVDLYDESILFVLCGRKTLKKKLKKIVPNKKERKSLLKMYDDGWKRNPTALALTSFTEGLPMMVSVKEMDTDNLTIANIQHEIFHCTSYILRWKGISLNEETEEAFAYLNDYITSKVHLEINQLVKKCWNKYIEKNYVKKYEYDKST